VAQREQGTTNESAKRTFTVTVIGVDEPKVDNNTLSYCAGETATSLQATKTEDNANNLYADAFVWSFEGNESVIAPKAETNVTSTTTYHYAVYQTYTIPTTSELCKGDSATLDVKVTYVPALSTSQVTYLKKDATNNVFSENVLQRKSDAVTGQEATATLNWYENDGTSACDNSSPLGHVAPTPTIDPSVAVGKDQKVYYCVSQTVDGCESELQQLTVVISDAPAPEVAPLSYCEGETASPLEATINTLTNPASAYTLQWYDASNNRLASAPTPLTTVNAGEKFTAHKYYVSQILTSTGAESTQSELVVTAYANPTLEITDPATVCEKTVDLTGAVRLENEVSGKTYTKEYYSDAAGTSSLSSTDVGKSGEYYVQYTYDVQSATGEVCKSKIELINVTVDTLSVTSSDVQTCPDKSADFTAEALTNVAGGAVYEWTEVGGSDSGTGDKFTTRQFAGSNYGEVFNYSLKVTAGTCEETLALKVKLGEGPIEGTLTLADADNTEKPSVVFNGKPSEPFYFCGNAVTVTPAYTKDAGTSYTLIFPDGHETPGATFSATEKGIYTLEFSNGCPTSVDFEIKDASIEIKHAEPQVLEMCEGETFTAKLNVTHADADYTTAWYKDGVVLGGNTDDNFSISQTVKSDGGLYKAVSTSHGCVSEDEIGELKVKTYIQFTNQTEPYIVTRGDEVTIPIQITEPSSGTVASVIWSENGAQTASGKENTLTVTSDHKYDIVMSDPDHCDATTTAEVWVDAKLVLSTAFDDSLCYGESREFTIDTTGTGSFRDGTFVLSVMEVQNGSVTDVTNKFSLVGGKLTADFAPTKDATYTVHYSYKNQDTTAVEKIQVLQPIEIVLASEQTVCEGTEATIKLASVSPVGTAIAWDADPTITGSLDTDEITVTAQFPAGSVGHRAKYAYNFTASFSICENKKMTAYLNVDEPLTGTIIGNDPICEGNVAVMNAGSFEASTYSWMKSDSTGLLSGPLVNTALDTTTLYLLHMTRGMCETDTTYEVKVTSNPKIERVDSVGIRSRMIVMAPGYGTPAYSYKIDSEFADANETKNNLKFTTHVILVSDANGCSDTMSFYMAPPPIFIPDFFTPNGDGINDSWIPANLKEIYPEAVVSIYDRFGKKLAEYKAADPDWDGTYKGKDMPTTDYWYEIEIEEIDKQYVGHFTLLRR